MMNRKKYFRPRRKQGLILLIVLGMLAMFSLLAVTYVVTSGASMAGSKALVVRARNSGLSISGTARRVLDDAIRGTNNQKSPFFNNSLIGDVFGPNPIRTQFGPTTAVRHFFAANTGVNLVKIPVDPAATLNGPLSAFENEYNSRILTVLEGPLSGQSFRILKYVGYIGTGDPNTVTTVPVPWSDPTLASAAVDPAYIANVQYSVLVDLNEVMGREFPGEYLDVDGTVKTVSYSMVDWIGRRGIASLFFFNSATPRGYKIQINDSPFNSAGIGLEDVAALPSGPVRGYGNIDSQRLLRTNKTISPALLTHYDYLQDGNLMATNPFNGIVGVDGIGTRRTQITQSVLNGHSNEGFDVPDYRDAWLAHQTTVAGTRIITPSYHRPEVINYISNLFGNPSGMGPGDVAELLRLIDASTARVLSYSFNGLVRNAAFRQNESISVPRNFTWSSPPTAAEISGLRAFVLNQITGPWDVDNDGDSIADAVWTDPSLASLFAPDGRRLRPLAAVTIEDMDGRVNLNTAGDRVQGAVGFTAGIGFDAQTNINYKRPGQQLPMGFGYGPAEISLSSLFKLNTRLLNSDLNDFSFFDSLTGARKYAHRPIVYNNVLDRVPGQVRTAVASSGSELGEREIHDLFSHNRLPGLPLARRGAHGMSYDRNGNPALISSVVPDGDPYAPFANSVASETRNDKYESTAMDNPISDDPLGLRDLESILRRYDEDAAALSDRLRSKLGVVTGGFNPNDPLNREITVRSGELRYPNLAAALKVWEASAATNVIGAQSPGTTTPGYLRYIQMLHSQRHRVRSFPPVASDDPEISYAALAELFPMDFAKGLRMDLNRPFGNGWDDNLDGEIDEPSEIASAAEQERYPLGQIRANEIRVDGAYTRDIKTNLASATRVRLGSRQILARNLYCLGQLIIPRDHQFPGMTGGFSLSNARIRATAIAQWAVNVVDFRDADAAMTRFEFDILPFGCGTNAGLTARPAYWAPDRIDQTVNGVSNKSYVGVVWGMEMPELLLTETFAIHNKNVRDTDMDNGSAKTTTDPTTPDPDFDQYRFPQASLFLEVYNPRTTDVVSNNLIPGAPSSLYSAPSSQVQLDLGRLPTLGTVPAAGVQPVWRIAISEPYTAGDTAHPNYILKNNDASLPHLTHQWSADPTARNGAPTLTTTVEQYVGNKLDYSLASTTATPPHGFERFVWFSTTAPPAGSTIPDSIPTMAGFGPQCVFVNQSGAALLSGGSYLVVGPRGQTPIGSLKNNPFTGVNYPAQLERTAITPANRPVLSPSFQQISLSGGVNTSLLNGSIANQRWIPSRVKTATSIVCTVPAPDDSAEPPITDWVTAFPFGIGLNVSFPRPVAGETIWTPANRPLVRLNSTDIIGTRSNGTPGYGDLTFAGFANPPDSWVDLGANPISASQFFPDHPIDKTNPVLAGRYATRTYEDFRVAYLQRLADPDFHYDPVSNPYITVDWMSIDLNVFNGEAPLGSETTDDPAPTATAVKFQSRYKNGELSPLASNHAVTNHGVSYHSPVTSNLRPSVVQTGLPAAVTVGTLTANPDAYFMYQMGYDKQGYGGSIGNSASSLGYCNVGYFTGAALPTNAEMDTATSAQFEAFGPPIDSTTAAYKGAPGRLAGVTWFNRPFASPYELMMVPLTGPGLFGLHHSAFVTPHSRDTLGYVPSYQTANAWNVNLPPSATSPGYWAVPEALSGGATRLADWPLLLDFVETQPPFADSTKYFPANTILALSNSNYPGAPTTLADRVAARFLNSYLMPNYTGRNEPFDVRGPSLLGPFNTKASFVAAGKINLNTIAFGTDGHSRALKALEHNYLIGNDRNTKEFSDLEAAFLASRQGFPITPVANNFLGAPVVGMHPDYPTRFVGAFRPATSANLAPVLSNATATEKMRSRYGVESTLLRSNDLTVNNQSLSALQAVATDRPMLLQATQIADELEATQPFVRMQRAMRLPNLVTNQSNVFAVWVTVSLFEYDPITGFGNEYIGENGLPERERQFFIVDRTIPVGYKPGENLNTERTILLQRKLP